MGRDVVWAFAGSMEKHVGYRHERVVKLVYYLTKKMSIPMVQISIIEHYSGGLLSRDTKGL